MTDRLIALDSDVFSSWIRGEVGLDSHLSSFSLALPVTVVEVAPYGWILAARKAEQRGREDLLRLLAP